MRATWKYILGLVLILQAASAPAEEVQWRPAGAGVTLRRPVPLSVAESPPPEPAPIQRVSFVARGQAPAVLGQPLPAPPPPPPPPSVFGPACPPQEGFLCDNAIDGKCPDSCLAKQPGARLWVSAEYLLWRVKDGPLASPLVTTSTNLTATNAAGFNTTGGLGVPGTQILFGNSLDYGTFSGGRVTAGLWFDCEATAGAEARGFLLERRSTGASFRSGPNGAPVLAIPVIDVAGAFGGGENAIAPAFPGIITGSIAIASDSRLWGTEGNVLVNLFREQDFTLGLLAGFRYADLSERLAIVTTATNLVPGTLNFQGNPAFVDGTITTSDLFRTWNQFYGGQLGARTEFRFGDLFVDLTGKVALGITHETVDIRGSTSVRSLAGATATANGGILALPSNIGRRTRDQFSVIPEVEAKVGYNFGEHVRAFVGYNFMYWTDVVRPGDQIDRRVDVRQVPGLQGVPGVPIVPVGTAPPLTFRRSDFWAHGVNFGLEFRY